MNIATLFASLALASSPAAMPAIDLAGECFALDPQDHGAGAKPEDWRFPDRIRLPGTVSGQGFGEPPSMKTQWTGATAGATPVRK
jgi:hypothetical protein